jgi:uncharacterized phage-associated protein
MPTAIETANEIIRLANAEAMPVDQMKLQKLLYYGQAWHLALNQVPLFDGRIEAWPWGPVVRDVYNQTRRYGRSPVTDLLQEAQMSDGHFKGYVIPKGIADEDSAKFVRNLWDQYKHYTGIQLSNATHVDGEPWKITYDLYGNLDSKPEIPNELIRQVFSQKLANA